MNKICRHILVALFVIGGAGVITSSLALAEEQNGSVTFVNRYSAVKGDAGKFRSHHWMKDGLVSGIENLTFDQKVGKDTDVSFEGYSIPAENNNGMEIFIKKGERHFLKTEYTTFRKYFDDVGGVWHPFVAAPPRLSNQDLEVDMGHFGIELGLGDEYRPDLSLMYERHTKVGKKSRLSWAAFKEGTVSKNISPTWQQIDETADVVTLKGKKEISGITVKSEQRAEFVESRNYRQEQSLSSTSTAETDLKIRAQEQKPKARALSSTLRGEKWVLDDKTFLALGYRFNNVSNTEKERLRELDRFYTPVNFSTNAEQRLLSDAENRSNEHIWTGHMQSNFAEDWIFISKMKVSYASREGSSTYPYDSLNASPDGIADNTQASRTENYINRLGENLSLRYSGIAHTALYAEAEFEQTRNYLSEFRDSIAGTNAGSTNEYFTRDTLTHINRTAWTLGGRVVPSQLWNLTAQVRRRAEDNDYDDQQETVSSSTLARSAFFDDLRIKGDEAETKFTLKPYHWMQNSVRYQFLNNKYLPRAEGQVNTKNRMLANILTFDTTLQPVDPLLVTLSFSHQALTTKTSAANSTSVPLPGFDATVDSWLASASYSPTETVTLINTVEYSKASNFNDYIALNELPLGAEFTEYDLRTQLDWSPKKGVKISPSYEYAMYDANPLVEVGNYSAHIAWLDLTFDW